MAPDITALMGYKLVAQDDMEEVADRTSASVRRYDRLELELQQACNIKTVTLKNAAYGPSLG